KLEDDFKYAAANLKSVQPQVGRANSWAAKAFLAKIYMIEQRFGEAQTLLTDIIENGVNSSGVKYNLNARFHDNFNAETKNSGEGVFQVQMAVKDRSSGHNGNGGEILNYPQGGPANCCGFFPPSFSLVNAFKTDPVSGLPLLDTWNDFDITND